MSEMVNKIADAMAESEPWSQFWSLDDARKLARVAIEAMREPTEAMVHAAFDLDEVVSGLLVSPIPEKTWGAMIDEALK